MLLNRLNTRIKELAQREAEHLLTLKPIIRPWHLIVMAAATISSTILFGALIGQLSTGMLASLGAMVILNIPNSGTLIQRQCLLFGLVLVMISSFGLGLVAHVLDVLSFPIFVIATFFLVVLGRYLKLSPPSCLFMLMAFVIALFMPVTWVDIPQKVAVVVIGAIYAWIVAFFYTLFVVRPSIKKALSIGSYQQGLLTESIIVTLFVVLSLKVAMMLKMSYPYWVPVSCYIVLQGTHLRTMWIKQLHRVLGTAGGIFVAWFLLGLALPPLAIAITIFMMFCWIETLITRHYGLAVLMITPMTIFIAEYSRVPSKVGVEIGIMAYQGIIQARLLDTVLGCSIALLGGIVMHSVWLRRPLMKVEAKLFPVDTSG